MSGFHQGRCRCIFRDAGDFCSRGVLNYYFFLRCLNACRSSCRYFSVARTGKRPVPPAMLPLLEQLQFCCAVYGRQAVRSSCPWPGDSEILSESWFFLRVTGVNEAPPITSARDSGVLAASRNP